MACENPFDAFRLATESLPDTAYVRGTFMDIWTNLIQKEAYPMSAGLVRSTFTIGRSEPTTDEPDFDVITTTTGETFTGTCGITYNDINYGFIENTYKPEQFGWKGPVVCVDDIFFNYKAAMFLEKYIPALQKNTIRTINNRMASIYTSFSSKAVANTDFHFIAGDITPPPPQSPVLTAASGLSESLCELTQEMLDATAVELNEEGAFEPNTNGWITLGEDGPVYPLYIGQEMSQRILLNNSELRQDRRWADAGAGDMAMLFQRIGATRVIKNFRHIINPYPPRYSWDGAQYVRTPTWVMSTGIDPTQPATKGAVAYINPDWRDADVSPFEAVWVLNPWVFHSESIPPVNSAAGLNWEPRSYMGELVFKTGGALIFDPPCYDPEMKLGRHFGSYKHAPKPIFPTYGRWIIFKRCPASDYDCVTCLSV